MASIGKDKGGRKRILFVAKDGRRKTIRLGKVSLRQAEAFKIKVQNLIGGRYAGGLDDETSRWLGGLEDDVYAKLVAVGLAESRVEPEPEPQMSIGQLCDQYISSRDDVGKGTLVVYGQTQRNLMAFFGYDKAIVELTEHDAVEWRRYLTREGLSEATVRKRCGVAKQFLRSVVKQKVVPSNPFRELKSTAISNPARQFFVSREIAQKVLDACPDAEWRVLFSLARFGGVRTPSEALALRWRDINWAENRILVHSRKTQHQGKGTRWIPLFPELLPHLRNVFEQAEPGSEYVVTKHRTTGGTLRKQLKQIAELAGITLWEKPFQNCRATRATELDEIFPSHVVASWMGHTQRIAEVHYLQTTAEHFQRAAQNPAQYPAATARKEPQATTGLDHGAVVFQDETADCDLVRVGTSGQANPKGLGDGVSLDRYRAPRVSATAAICLLHSQMVVTTQVDGHLASRMSPA